ncbi:MAG: hypothetical protein ACRDIV_17420 [Ktedonobacteraceae bacterium]
MKFNNQERSSGVALSAAKGLARGAERSFVAQILRCAQNDIPGFGR